MKPRDRPTAEADVVVHVHPTLPLWPASLVTLLLPLWQAAGLRTQVVTGPAPVGGARLGILHVDLTRVPPDYARLRSAYPALLNGAVEDIGKRRLDAGLGVSRHDAYDGPVIVKTDLNAGGVPERVSRRHGQAWPARLAGTVLDNVFPRRPTGRWWHRDRTYPIFPTKRAVPSWVWRRPDLLVQRFVPEPAARGYALRVWFFMGDADLHFIHYARDPLVKLGRGAGADLLGDVPPELQAIRANLGFDFGKFEYVLWEGKPALLDANKTPSFGVEATPFHRPALLRLARGIERWL
jgi:hypothetical protein